MNFVSNIIWNSVEGFVEAGTRTAGGYAGDALLKAGDLIEGSGRSVGNGIERTASGYGNKLSSGAPASAPSTAARKPAVRSNSSPASSKPRTPTTKTAIGTNKYPGGKQFPSGARQLTTSASKTAGGAPKALSGAGTKALGGVSGASSKALGGVSGVGSKALSGAGSTVSNATRNPLPKPYPNNTPYGTKTTPSSTANKASTTKTNSLPKPYPGSSFPSHNNNNPAKKTAVRPGAAPKPFNPAGAANSLAGAGKGDAKPYPGTNTLPGQSGRTPVKAQKYKPMERMKPQVEAGKMQHFAF